MIKRKVEVRFMGEKEIECFHTFIGTGDFIQAIVEDRNGYISAVPIDCIKFIDSALTEK